jgi:hypothetical protein
MWVMFFNGRLVVHQCTKWRICNRKEMLFQTSHDLDDFIDQIVLRAHMSFSACGVEMKSPKQRSSQLDCDIEQITKRKKYSGKTKGKHQEL